jgi:ferredoxin, 2Fe-2S
LDLTVPDITFITPGGSMTTLNGQDGDSVMTIALQNGIDGIIGECGGSCACATCHVYVDEEFLEQVGEPSDLESDMLEGTASDRTTASRLSCQIALSPELNGLRVRLPEAQI